MLLLLVACMATGGLACTSWTNCPKNPAGTLESDVLAFLSLEAQLAALRFAENAFKAVGIIKTFGRIVYDDKLYLHSTVAYLCGYTLEQYEKQVFPAMRNVSWQPFNVSFDRVVCNFDNATSNGSANTSSIILLLDPASQASLSTLVESFEAAIRATGLPVRPRSLMEPFHCTIAKVPPSFPVAQAVAAVNAVLSGTAWTGGEGPIRVSRIASLLPPAEFHSS